MFTDKFFKKIIISFMMFSGISLAETNPLEEVGKTALVQSEQRLSQYKEIIDNFVKVEITKDGLISAEEIKRWSLLIKDFSEMKKKEDQYLNIFKVQTSTEVDPLYREIINLYQDAMFRLGSRHQNLIKLLLKNLTATDLKIKTDFLWSLVFIDLFLVIIGSKLFYWYLRR